MELLVGSIFRNAAVAVPDRVAAVLGDTSITFGQLDRRANRLARALAGLGVGPGDRVATWTATDLDVVPLFAALAKAGAVFAPVNGLLGASEATEIIRAVRPKALIVDADREGDGASVAQSAGMLVCTLDQLAGAAAAEDDADVRADGLRETDPHVVFFTSGSTGRPKGVVLSHRANYLRTHPGAQLEPRGAKVCPFPLFHMGAWTIALQQWQARDRVVLLESADAVAICDAIEHHRATRINCVPAVWRRVLDHLASAEGTGRDMSSVRFADSGTSATPLELLTAIEHAFPNAAVRVFYGSTEAGAVTSLEPADVHRKPGSCGVAAPHAEVMLGPDGEVRVRGPLLFDGYFEDPVATAEALVDGWYHTGDVAAVDEEGYYTIVGRVKDVIRTGGETVAPPEVEAVLARHPAVADVAVVGVPDATWGEVVCAVVVVAAGADTPDLDELRAQCRDELATFKHPRRLEVVNAIPRTASTNQVQRRLIVERLT